MTEDALVARASHLREAEAGARRKLDSLQAQADAVTADLNAIIGAIQECEHWLGVVRAPVPEQ